MSLLHLTGRRGRPTSSRKASRAFRPALRPDVESLELRTVLSGPGSALLAPAVAHSPLTITGAQVTNLAVTGANSLLATVNLTGTLNTVNGATPVALPSIQVPITATLLRRAPRPAAPRSST